MQQSALEADLAEFENELNGADDNLKPLIDEVFETVDLGLAVFDERLKLIHANDFYLQLCEYERGDVPVGTTLTALIEKSLKAQNYSAEYIERSIATTKLRLNVGGRHKLRFKTNSGNTIEVERLRSNSGKLVEMVRNFSDPTGSVGAESEFKVIAETAHARMAHVLDSMLDGFALYDADDRLVFYNHNFIDLNPGIADILKPGMRHEDLVKESVARGGINTMGMAPQQYVQWRMHQHFNPGEPHEHEISDGRWIRILEQQNPDGSTTSTQSDITEIKKREIEHLRISGALDERNDQFNFAINHMIQGLCMFDEDQKLLLCNRQYLDMYGFSTEVVKPGITLSDIMMYSISLGNYHERDAQAAVKARHDPDKLKKRTTIKQHLRDGRVMAVMNEPMENGGSIATYQDITIVEKHEATLLEYTKKLERSNRELQDFAHVASHDLQEPLRKIEAFGDRLATKHGDILPDDGKMFVERMQNAATRMRQLINDLLDYSRVTTQAKPFVKVDIGEVLEGVLSDLQVQLQESSGKIEYADMPTIDAEKTQMRQLFQNLLSNALKFRKPDRDPVIKITATKHSGEADGRRAYWEFRLADNGIGFDNAYKDQIFTIFQRLHGRTEFEGTGIGLATVRKIIERHEGTIDADGVPDVGATFIIQLPECQEQHEDNAA